MAYRVNIFDPKKIGLQRLVSEALSERGIRQKHVYSTIICTDADRSDIVAAINSKIAGRTIGGYNVGTLTKMDGKPCWYYRTQTTPARQLRGWVNVQSIETEITLKLR